MKRSILAALWLCLASPGCSAPDGDLPPDYRRLPVPEARLASPEARQRGRGLFVQYCALCHGERADGRGVRQSGLTTRPRDFTDPAWRARATPRAVYHAIREGVRGTTMPSWRSLSEDEGWDLTAYVLSAAGLD